MNMDLRSRLTLEMENARTGVDDACTSISSENNSFDAASDRPFGVLGTTQSVVGLEYHMPLERVVSRYL